MAPAYSTIPTLTDGVVTLRAPVGRSPIRWSAKNSHIRCVKYG